MTFKINPNIFSVFLNKAIKVGLLLLLFLLPFQTRYIYHSSFVHGNFWEYGSQSIYATEILIWILIVLSLIKFFLNRQKLNSSFVQNPVWKRILILSMPLVGLLLMFVSVIKSVDPGQSWYFVFHFLETVSLISVFIISEISFEKSSIALWLGGVMQALLAIAQFYLQGVFASKWLGMALHLPSHFGAGVIETGSGRWLRAYGSFGWPNSLGFYLAIVWVLGFILYAGFILNKNFTSKDSKFFLAIFTAGQLLILGGLFLSFSRAAWLAAIVGLGSLVFLQYHRRRVAINHVSTPDDTRSTGVEKHCNASLQAKVSWSENFLWRQIIYSLSLVTFFLLTLWPLFSTRLNPTTRLESRSVNERLVQYTEAQKIITQHFWFGVGPGNYSNYLNKIHPSLQVWQLQPVHSIFLLEMAEMGVLFSIFHSLLFLFLIFFVWKRNRLFLSIILTLLFTGLFDHWGWSLYGGQLLWGTVFGMVLVKQKE